jgi:hypothetical protein
MGDYTIQQVLELTDKYFPTRYDYRDRDVLRRVIIKRRKEINAKDPSQPQHYFQIETFSYPQYGEYLTMTGRRGRPRRYQRTVRHQYDNILTVQELSLQTNVWKYRLGSQKKWRKQPPQKQIKQLYSRTKEQYKRKARRRAGEGATQQEINRQYKRIVERHKRNAPYLSVGDYNSQELGINADFIFRDAWALRTHGHLYGNMAVLKPSSLNPKSIPYFPKHGLRLIEVLLNRGILQP